MVLTSAAITDELNLCCSVIKKHNVGRAKCGLGWPVIGGLLTSNSINLQSTRYPMSLRTKSSSCIDGAWQVPYLLVTADQVQWGVHVIFGCHDQDRP